MVHVRVKRIASVRKEVNGKPESSVADPRTHENPTNGFTSTESVDQFPKLIRRKAFFLELAILMLPVFTLGL